MRVVFIHVIGTGTELFIGDVVRITTQLIDCDHKRVHYYHKMYNEETGELAAVNECLAMNISLAEKCSTDFPEKIQKKLAAVRKKHEICSLPEGGGRLSIRRK